MKKKDNKETLYARVERENKLFIENVAHKERISEAFVVNQIITEFRKSAKTIKPETHLRRLKSI